MSAESDTLARLDQGDKDHERDLAEVKALWEREDAVTKENRDKVLASFEQGARDRAEARQRVKEAMDPPINPRFTRAEIARLQAALDEAEAPKTPVITHASVPAEAPRMSSLPVVSWSTPEEPPKT